MRYLHIFKHTPLVASVEVDTGVTIWQACRNLYTGDIPVVSFTTNGLNVEDPTLVFSTKVHYIIDIFFFSGRVLGCCIFLHLQISSDHSSSACLSHTGGLTERRYIWMSVNQLLGKQSRRDLWVGLAIFSPGNAIWTSSISPRWTERADPRHATGQISNHALSICGPLPLNWPTQLEASSAPAWLLGLQMSRA